MFAKERFCLEHGVAGALLFLLMSKTNRRALRKRYFELVREMAYDHAGCLGSECVSRPQHMFD